MNPKLTQRMTMHLNGGSEFSELRFAILADNKETGVTRHRRTNGSPKYIITDDILRCGDETFDVLATKGVGMIDWIVAHLTEAQDAR